MAGRWNKRRDGAATGDGVLHLYGHCKAEQERELMGRFLTEWPWCIYCTWTFREPMGEVGAVKRIRWWLRLIEFGFGSDVGWMIGVEQDRDAPWPHAHGLICGRRVADPVVMYEGRPHERRVPLIEPYWRAWFDRHGAGKFEVIDPLRGHTAPSFYCAKYATKRGTVFFSENLEAFHGTANPVKIPLYPSQGVLPDV